MLVGQPKPYIYTKQQEYFIFAVLDTKDETKYYELNRIKHTIYTSAS
jgi:hypothetical protein